MGQMTAGTRQDSMDAKVLLLTGLNDTVVPSVIQKGWLEEGFPIKLIAGDGHFWDDSATSHRVSAWIEHIS
jgi:hypothetical protein